MYVAIRKREEMVMDPARKTQIETQSGAQNRASVGILLFNKALTEVPAEYSDYINVFLAKNAAELLENTEMNEHAIELEEGKQPSFGPIYSLSPVELETLKIYIKTNLANSFIRSFKSPVGALIFFDWKLNKSLHLCMDYRGLKNLTIKNRYLLPLIGESLN